MLISIYLLTLLLTLTPLSLYLLYRCLCLTKESIPNYTQDRISLVLTPYFNPPSGSIGSLDLLLQPPLSPHTNTAPSKHYTTTATTVTNKRIAITAAKNLIDICLSTLVAGVASSDLQYLIDPSTGEVLLIDFTEAAIILPSTTPTTSAATTSTSTASTAASTSTGVVVPLSDYQRQLVYNFISELQAAIPTSIYSEVEPYTRREMRVKLGAIEQYASLFPE